MKTLTRNILFCLLSVLIISSCSKTQEIHLGNDWFMSAGKEDDTYEFAKLLKYNRITGIQDLPSEISRLGISGDYIWLRKNFNAGQDITESDIHLCLGRISFSDETYVNGIMIGKIGSMEPGSPDTGNKFRVYLLPKGTLFHDRENEILIKVYYNGRAGFFGSPFCTIDKEIKHKYDAIYYLRTAILSLFSFFGFILFFFFIFKLIEIKNNRRVVDKFYLYHSLFFIFFAVYLLRFVLPDIAVFHVYFIRYDYFYPFFFSILIVFSMYQFFFSTSRFNHYSGLFPLKIITCFALFIASYLLLIFTGPIIERVTSDVVETMSAILLLISATIVFLNRKDKNFFSDFYISAIMLYILAADIFIGLLMGGNRIILSGYAFFIASMAMVFKEKSFFEKSILLKGSNSEIYRVSLDYVSNVRLLNDLRVVRMVEFTDNSWELSACIKGAGDYATDRFELLLQGNSFIGLTSTDISGKSPVSATLSEISGEIIKKHLLFNLDEQLSRSIFSANTEISSHFKESGLFLSGAFLKFVADGIEYVNNAYPDVLCRRAQSGNAGIVGISGSDKRSSVLGVEFLAGDIDQLKFNVEKDDIILVHSDGLLFAKNKNGEMYGISRIVDSLKHAGCVSSRAVLEFMINDFMLYKFPGKTKDIVYTDEFLNDPSLFKVEDDIVIIVLRKL